MQPAAKGRGGHARALLALCGGAQDASAVAVWHQEWWERTVHLKTLYEKEVCVVVIDDLLCCYRKLLKRKSWSKSSWAKEEEEEDFHLVLLNCCCSENIVAFLVYDNFKNRVRFINWADSVEADQKKGKFRTKPPLLIPERFTKSAFKPKRRSCRGLSALSVGLNRVGFFFNLMVLFMYT
jgi:hypothetical protein